MRFSLVLLNLFFILTTGVSYAETLCGRVIELDRSATGVTVALETIDSATTPSRRVSISIADLPVDIQLNSHITLEATVSPTTENQGVVYHAATAKLAASANKGQDRTGVRARMKRSQRGATAGRGSQRGKN